jgi:hypothetical protein
MAGETDEPIGEWLGFWFQLLGLGVLAILGAMFAANGGRPGDYESGLVLCLAAVALLFLRLKYRLDGGADGCAEFLLVDRPAALTVVVPLFAILGLAGLFTAAAWGEGSLHDAGIALFIASGLIVFFSLKHVFDTLDRHR